jgi:hypothetical protein
LFNSANNIEVELTDIANKIICYIDGDGCQKGTDGYQFVEELLSKNPEFLAMVKAKVKEIFAQRVNQLCQQHEVH